MVGEYRKSKRRLILLDYDGTIVPFADRPDEAKPDEDVMNLLRLLAQDGGNEVVIVSGRDRKFLDEWFGDTRLSLVAEHGAWLKERGAEWLFISPLEDDWKKDVFPVLKQYVGATPGSFIEEKSFSLVWHYRAADPKVGESNAKELRGRLKSLAASLNLEVLEGSKTVEVKSSGVNKGRAILHWVSRGGWDFMLAVGDDATDEDMFAVLPKTAYSIKVRVAPSKARFVVESVGDVRSLLREMVGIPSG
ncbi:MAG: trehalose-phosphatase [Candidatus Freyarchaeota archaeon]|nr:trehalose-phosphatase [Candidatus Jordarchaeia archaeon]